MPAIRVLVVDNQDSFTFMLADYLRRAGALTQVWRSDSTSVDAAFAAGADAFVLSPGPGAPQQSAISVALAAACIAEKRPLLGVCLGHQAIALACGTAVRPVDPVHGKIGPVRHDGSGLFAGLPSPFMATRYHSLACIAPQAPLLPNAWSADGTIMGIRHQSAPVHAVQFHPESIGSEHGLALLANFLALAEPLAKA